MDKTHHQNRSNATAFSSKAHTLSFHNLTIGYVGHVLVSDVSAAVTPGSLVCLLGRNGIGKSTLLRTMAGLQLPMSGSVLVDDIDISTLSLGERAHYIGIVLSSHTDSEEMSVSELVALGRSPYTGFFGKLSAADRHIVDRSLSLVGISHLAARRVVTLSDGERQKSMIARTLAQQTPIILLDEPTAFLDFPSSVEVFRLLRRLAHEEQKTILMTCHDIQLALRMADCIWLFDETLSVHQPPLSAAVLRSFLGDEATDILLSQSI